MDHCQLPAERELSAAALVVLFYSVQEIVLHRMNCSLKDRLYLLDLCAWRSRAKILDPLLWLVWTKGRENERWLLLIGLCRYLNSRKEECEILN